MRSLKCAQITDPIKMPHVGSDAKSDTAYG